MNQGDDEKTSKKTPPHGDNWGFVDVIQRNDGTSTSLTDLKETSEQEKEKDGELVFSEEQEDINVADEQANYLSL